MLEVAAAYDKSRKVDDNANDFKTLDVYAVCPLFCTHHKLNWWPFVRDGRSGSLDPDPDLLLADFWIRYITTSGRRSDTAHHFIYNQEHNKNLHVITEHRVNRVLFE